MNNADSLLGKINAQILNPIIVLMIAIAVVVFLYGLVEFIAGAGSEDKRQVGKRHIIWGLIGMFIMFSVFGIMQILANFWE